ncbi:hypothetical protein [Candidatus Liberibacter brunswickensis]|uniref:hypothetical protein n=1 Tax=Candidatus Liberibacter brunswickensis TaxID=1968796 RepID=UPI002FDF53FF
MSSTVQALKPSVLYLGFSMPIHELVSIYSCLHAHLNNDLIVAKNCKAEAGVALRSSVFNNLRKV